MSKVFAIFNQKGGVGKTTTSINLAIGLAMQGKKVLLIDLDSQANSTMGLGYNPDHINTTITSILERIINKEYDFDIDYGVIHHVDTDKEDENYSSGACIDLIPSDMNLSTIEVAMSAQNFGRDRFLRQYVERVKDNYDYIIIDCLPSVGLLAINALVASDKVIIPIQSQFYSIKGLEQLFRTIQSVIDNGMNDKLSISGVLYTGVEKNTRSYKAISEQLLEIYGKNIKIYKNSIPKNIDIKDSPGYGLSVYAYNADSSGSKAYLNFTKEFLELEEAI